jgi:hypothetical protein
MSVLSLCLIHLPLLFANTNACVLSLLLQIIMNVHIHNYIRKSSTVLTAYNCIAHYFVLDHVNIFLSTVILSYIHISLLFCHYISCIYSYILWNVLTVLLTIILSHIHISPMFCYYISCIHTYKFWNIYGQCPSHGRKFPSWTVENIHI